MDFSNWSVERQRLKDEIFKELREQEDRKALLILTGTKIFNPHTDTDKAFTIYFSSKFQSAPTICFGQKASSEYVVVPYYQELVNDRGVVDGFKLGVYPLTDPPDAYVRHTIDWIAYGKASRYREENIAERWRNPYDNDTPEESLFVDGRSF